jgi:hypothetical protein
MQLHYLTCPRLATKFKSPCFYSWRTIAKICIAYVLTAEEDLPNLKMNALPLSQVIPDVKVGEQHRKLVKS